MKPVIGLIPLYDDEKESYWMLPGYMKVLEKCGALPIMLPLTDDRDELEQCMELCDGILLTGGHDVGPEVYGETATNACGIPCRLRDQMESYLLHGALERDMPVFGICRGVQFLNAALGGTLYQDLPTEYESTVEHHMAAPYDREAHKVEILPGTILAAILGEGIHSVNSYHHQAIRDLAPGVTLMAVSEDGLSEAIGVPDKKFVMGVQWHPEFSYESNAESRKLVQAFVDACT
ncbi:MAG: gamma-glutamyl-gamma-aminobutyrate hydrolase family protein [Lachnospiraceae bacterium]|nr:gamma-glutamyl-gamma-aminobutyrate hydrolase family protein [Lachnospiraceae bacterium]